MKAKEIRELRLEEIVQRIAEEQEKLDQLKFQHAIADLQNPMQIKHSRRLVARLKSILKEKAE
ncbi:MAG: 50S ribosomal protein L29 [Rhodothermaceae bacterium]|nr:50S ribosomal protein L29 [Rhodothermaceae bacterium]